MQKEKSLQQHCRTTSHMRLKFLQFETVQKGVERFLENKLTKNCKYIVTAEEVPRVQFQGS